MLSNGHGGFGERHGETDRWQHRNRAPCRLNEGMTLRWGFISAHRADFGVQRICRVLQVSRSQRPTNENTNGLLRQYFPKGTDLSRWSAEDLEAVALAINNRPRKILGWKTPAEVLEEQLRSLQQPGVATTG